MYAQICPQHPDEFVQAVVVNDDGLLSYTCDRAGHVTAGDFVWSGVAESNATESISGLAAELSLDTALPAAIAQYPGKWIEYGGVEAAYAQANPEEFAHLIQEHGHRAIKPSKYTISKYLASILGILGRNGAIAFHTGPATGRWNYLGKVSWWSSDSTLEWTPENQVSVAGAGLDASYVPGSKD